MNNLRKYHLHRAFAVGPQVFTQITLREPSARDLMRMGKDIATASNYETARAAIALITGLDHTVIDDKISPRDFFELGEMVASMLEAIEGEG